MGVINDKGFPFTNVDGDRLYSSETWREYFNALVEGGIVGDIGNEFVVTEISVPAKKIKIDTGSVLLKGAMRTITTAIELDVDENTSGNTRIDRVIARLDIENREIDFHILKGTTDAEPVAPSLTRTTDIWEVSFAQIELANGYATILNENITDERDTEGVCEYFRYRAKPAWYPEHGDVPIDAWMYVVFKNKLTSEEISDIEANPTLMDIINNSSTELKGKYCQFSGGIERTGSAQTGILTFSTEDIDEFNAIDLSSSYSRITIPSDINRVRFYWYGETRAAEISGGLPLSVSLYKNGGPFRVIWHHFLNKMDYRLTGLHSSGIIECSEGDYFEIYVNLATSSVSYHSKVLAGSIFGMEVLG